MAFTDVLRQLPGISHLAAIHLLHADGSLAGGITGWGAAPKEQVARMVKSVLGLAETPPPDATDALALALCHAHTNRGLRPGEPL